ncbi:hypothetical protein BRY73_20010 [Ochrobactrum sp. P6BS-III]|nr:hypothetical protein BRY73_20010 [Ochrobactrum sp. P6BS-III]
MQTKPYVKRVSVQNYHFPCQIIASAISAKIDVDTASTKMIQLICVPHTQLNDLWLNHVGETCQTPPEPMKRFL